MHSRGEHDLMLSHSKLWSWVFIGVDLIHHQKVDLLLRDTRVFFFLGGGRFILEKAKFTAVATVIPEWLPVDRCSVSMA